MWFCVQAKNNKKVHVKQSWKIKNKKKQIK